MENDSLSLVDSEPHLFFNTFLRFNRMNQEELHDFLNHRISVANIAKLFFGLLRGIVAVTATTDALIRKNKVVQGALLAQAVYLYQTLDLETRDRLLRFDELRLMEEEKTLSEKSLDKFNISKILRRHHTWLLEPFIPNMRPKEVVYVLYGDANEKANHLLKHFPKSMPSEIVYLFLSSKFCTQEPLYCTDALRRAAFEQCGAGLPPQYQAYFMYKEETEVTPQCLLEWTGTVIDVLQTYMAQDPFSCSGENEPVKGWMNVQRSWLDKQTNEWIVFRKELEELDVLRNPLPKHN